MPNSTPTSRSGIHEPPCSDNSTSNIDVNPSTGVTYIAGSTEETSVTSEVTIPPQRRTRRKGDVVRIWFTALLLICVVLLLGLVYHQRTVIEKYKSIHGELSFHIPPIYSTGRYSHEVNPNPDYKIRVVHPNNMDIWI